MKIKSIPLPAESFPFMSVALCSLSVLTLLRFVVNWQFQCAFFAGGCVCVRACVSLLCFVRPQFDTNEKFILIVWITKEQLIC